MITTTYGMLASKKMGQTADIKDSSRDILLQQEDTESTAPSTRRLRTATDCHAEVMTRRKKEGVSRISDCSRSCYSWYMHTYERI